MSADLLLERKAKVHEAYSRYNNVLDRNVRSQERSEKVIIANAR